MPLQLYYQDFQAASTPLVDLGLQQRTKENIRADES